MKTAIVFMSQHHGNTKKVAEEMASTLQANLTELSKTKPENLEGFDLIGFGSGVYGSNLHKDMFSLIEGLPKTAGKKAFVFSTSGSGKRENNQKLKEALSAKGFRVLGDFSCKGSMAWGPLKLFGGSNKGSPSQEDLANAKAFAESIKKQA